jgi:hypothetical protein
MTITGHGERRVTIPLGRSVSGRSAFGPSRPLWRIPVMVSFLTHSGHLAFAAGTVMARARLCRTSVIGARELSPGNEWIAEQATEIIRARPSGGGP